MEGLFYRPTFTSFGPCALAAASEPLPLHQVFARRPAGLRTRVQEECPRRPGVYGMLNRKGELIYVGKAKCLRARLQSYFRPASRDAKAGRIVGHTRGIVWEPAPSEFAALLRELELIRRWRPRFNVQGQPHRRRRTYVCVGRQPAPYVFLARRPSSGVLEQFGPIPAGRKAREAVRRLNDWFRLRDCPQHQAMVFADQAELFPVLRAAGCLRHEIGTCSGPCAAACTRRDYGIQVRSACAFLKGSDLTPLQTLESAMQDASAATAFERAAALRDKLDLLRWLHRHLERLRHVRERYSFVYTPAGHDGEDVWYLIRAGQVVEALPAPRTPDEYRAAARRVRAVFRRSDDWPRLVPFEEMDGLLLVAAWFRKHKAERERVFDPDAMLTTCRQAPQLPR